VASGLHEEFSREHAVEAASNKRFGLVVGGIALVFGCLRAWWHDEVGLLSGALMAIGLALIAAALIKPDVLAGAHRRWMQLGLLLHKVTNPLFLGAMYAIAIVPTGLMMRLFGVDPMGLRRPRGETFWIARGKGSSSAESLEKPF
jgi:Saxitoxin biosynthesis operon protein SxtJ